MTVEELIEMLKKYPKDMEVVILHRLFGGFIYGPDDKFHFHITHDGKLAL